MHQAAAQLRRGGSDIQLIAALTEVPAALIALMSDDLLSLRRDLLNEGVPAATAAPYRFSRRGRTRVLAIARAMSMVSLGCSAVALGCGLPAVADVGVAAALLAVLSCRLAARTRR